MKTVTRYIYASYSEYSPDGIRYNFMSKDEREWADRCDDYKYVCEVTIPEIDKSFVIESGISQLDLKNAELQAQILANNAKKQQLLAIEHTGR